MVDSDSDDSLEHFAFRGKPSIDFKLQNFKYMLGVHAQNKTLLKPDGLVGPDDPSIAAFTTLQAGQDLPTPVACIRALKQGTAFAVTPVCEMEGMYDQLWLTADHVTKGSAKVKLATGYDVSNFQLHYVADAEVMASGSNSSCGMYYAPPDSPGFHESSLENGIGYEDVDVSLLCVTATTKDSKGFSDSFLVPYSTVHTPDTDFCEFALQGYPSGLNEDTVCSALHLDKHMPKAKRKNYVTTAQALYFPSSLNISIGRVVSSNRYLVKHNASSLRGMSGGPGMPVSALHTFAFIQIEGGDVLNIGVSKDHACLVSLYSEYILPRLTSVARQGLLPEAQLMSLKSWVKEHEAELPGAAEFYAACEEGEKFFPASKV